MIKKIVLTTITLVMFLCPNLKANANNVDDVKAIIVKSAIELGIDPALALSIAKTESGFRHDSTSRRGAVGVFQLMPSTAKRLGVNPYYLSDNIKGGLMYYKMMYKMYGSTELALAAYNAGPVAVNRCNKTVPPYGETRKFVSSIMQEYSNQKVNPDKAIRNVPKNAPPKFSFYVTPVAKSKPIVKTVPSTNKPIASVVPVVKIQKINHHETKENNLNGVLQI
ncbi:lytic transglycosylase domain-containing protein [bacterium]|nr:lytic transglycosylase domain-containing protein [bacterium]